MLIFAQAKDTLPNFLGLVDYHISLAMWLRRTATEISVFAFFVNADERQNHPLHVETRVENCKR